MHDVRRFAKQSTVIFLVCFDLSTTFFTSVDHCVCTLWNLGLEYRLRNRYIHFFCAMSFWAHLTAQGVLPHAQKKS